MSYLLEMKGICKDFGPVKVIKNFNLKITKGEIIALCGENGSGKSTLMKVLCGIYPYGSYQGEIIFNNEVLKARKIRDTEKRGIAIIHQELALVKHLTILENIFLGVEISHFKFGVLDYDSMMIECQKLLSQVNLHISPSVFIKDLGLGQKQLVEIAKALHKRIRLLILDEPTACLTEKETSVLLRIISNLQTKGISCIYISHKLSEIKEISNRVSIIRDGHHIGNYATEKISDHDIINMMVGRQITDLYPKRSHKKKGKTILNVQGLTAWHPTNKNIRCVDNVSFSLHRGEILGIAGLVGAGRTEVAKCLFGIWSGKLQGKILINNREVTLNNCRQAIFNRIVMVSEDRKKEGIIPTMSVGDNITIATLNQFTRFFGYIDHDGEQQCIEHTIKNFKVKTSSNRLPIKYLSGGNQQKAILARSLLLKPEILVLDEPTRGIDVGAKCEIYKLISQLAEENIAVIVISSELPEVLGVSDRVLVMHEGKMKGNLLNHNLKQEQVMEAALRR